MYDYITLVLSVHVICEMDRNNQLPLTDLDVGGSSSGLRYCWCWRATAGTSLGGGSWGGLM